MWETVFEYVLVFVIGAFAGGWTLPAGIAIGLEPVGVFIAAWLGTVASTIVWMVFGGRGRDALAERFGDGIEERVANSRASVILDRWGMVGLSTFGLVVVGPTLTMLTVLIVGLDRRRFVILSSISTFVLFGVLTAFWTVVL